MLTIKEENPSFGEVLMKKEKKSNHNSFSLEERNVFLSTMIEYATPSWRLRTMLFTRTARGWREKRCNCFKVSSFILMQDFSDIYVYVAIASNAIMCLKFKVYQQLQIRL